MNSSFFSNFFLYVPVKLIPAFVGIFFVFFLYRFFPVGQYVSYSVCVTSALISAQLFAGWVGNSFIYNFSESCNQNRFFSSSFVVVLTIAPIAGLLAATICMFFVSGDYVFVSVWGLCFSQILFFFLSSVCQSTFLVKSQLIAVVLQASTQTIMIFVLFNTLGVDFRYALVALLIGYLSGAVLLLSKVVKKFGFSNPIAFRDYFVTVLASLYSYGAALSPWIFGMLVMAAADRFAIGYYKIEHGDTYLSLKDLFVGGAGLLSMPLLMMVHPLVIKRFREKRFAVAIIESSFGFLMISFSLLWCALLFVGFEFFERLTGKEIDVSLWVIFFSYFGVFLNSSAVYIQKRLEVHRKMKRLAFLSLGSAVASMVFACIGGKFWGIDGIAFGAMLAQGGYFVLVASSIYKKLNVYRCFVTPFVVSTVITLVSFAYYHFLSAWMPSEDWRVNAALWLAGFTGLGLLTLWKGVHWKEFTK